MSFARADNTGSVTARHFSPVQNSFENACRFGRQSSESLLFFRPQNDSRTKPLCLDKAFHERDLIDARTQKESGKLGQRFFAESAATIKIVTPGSVGIGEMPFASLNIARQTTGNRPDTSRIQRLQQHGV